MNYKQHFYILFLLMVPVLSNAQNYAISMGNANACQGDAVEISVSGTNLNNVGAITLFINYNPDNLQFDTLVGIHPALAGLIYNDIEDSTSSSIGKIGISWSAFVPANPGNDNLFVLNFVFTGTATSLEFDSLCEIADFNANILNITYTDAWVNFTDTISIIAQPENQNILTNSIAEFLVDADNVQSYAWQSFENGTWLTLFDGGIISGASTNSLSIINPGLDWNGRYFRCQLSGCNNAVSDSAILQVQLGDGFLYETNIDWDFYPNPLRENAHIFLHLLPASHCNLQLFDSKGIFIEELCDGIISSTDELLLFSAKKYPAGNYIIKLKINVHGKIMCSEKQIIITN